MSKNSRRYRRMQKEAGLVAVRDAGHVAERFGFEAGSIAFYSDVLVHRFVELESGMYLASPPRKSGELGWRKQILANLTPERAAVIVAPERVTRCDDKEAIWRFSEFVAFLALKLHGARPSFVVTVGPGKARLAEELAERGATVLYAPGRDDALVAEDDIVLRDARELEEDWRFDGDDEAVPFYVGELNRRLAWELACYSARLAEHVSMMTFHCACSEDMLDVAAWLSFGRERRAYGDAPMDTVRYADNISAKGAERFAEWRVVTSQAERLADYAAIWLRLLDGRGYGFVDVGEMLDGPPTLDGLWGLGRERGVDVAVSSHVGGVPLDDVIA